MEWEQLAEGMSTEGEVMDASGAPVTDELTGVHHSPQRHAIYEPEKTARRKAHYATSLLNAKHITHMGTTSLNNLLHVLIGDGRT